jgi:LytS/YehU family sensor histidine kinase
LKKENLQVQLDSLKNQVNPHFLFNSLNALSFLIDNDVHTAKQYVNELAMVYRNILDSNEKTLSTLREELEFLDSYFFLLQTRYGTNLKKDISISEKYFDWNIPPLTLQMLVENAVKHNIISASQPLTIKIHETDGNLLIVSNNLQKINDHKNSGKIGLENITSKYRLLNQQDVVVIENGESFKVLLPLIKNNSQEHSR